MAYGHPFEAGAGNYKRTGLPLAADMLTGGAAPPGYGHNFAAEHDIDAWLALMEPDGWTEDGIRRLKALHAR